MALLSKDDITEKRKNKNTVHGKIEATYTVFSSEGKRYFQIDTYGSPDREWKNKVSQSIQMDEEVAEKLIKLLMKTFNINIK